MFIFFKREVGNEVYPQNSISSMGKWREEKTQTETIGSLCWNRNAGLVGLATIHTLLPPLWKSDFSVNVCKKEIFKYVLQVDNWTFMLLQLLQIFFYKINLSLWTVKTQKLNPFILHKNPKQGIFHITFSQVPTPAPTPSRIRFLLVLTAFSTRNNFGPVRNFVLKCKRTGRRKLPQLGCIKSTRETSKNLVGKSRDTGDHSRTMAAVN